MLDSISNMPKFIYSLAIAFGIHLAIFGLSNFFIESRPTTIFLDNKNKISLDLTSGKGAAAKISKASSGQSNRLSVISSPETSTSGNPEKALVPGPGTEGSGGGFTFENSAVYFPDPIYPKLAIKRGLEGNVRIRIKVSSEGLSDGVEILKSSSHESLDKAAVESVTSWRFQKRPTVYFIDKNIVFQLRN